LFSGPLRKYLLAVEAHTCYPSTGRLKQEDCEFKASLGYERKERRREVGRKEEG
jgi:hypothetical protein